MAYLDALKANKELIEAVGEDTAHLVWCLALYLEEPDVEALASEALTDGPDDKKIDFIYFDRDRKRILFAQGTFGTGKKKDSAPANKASDLNTAAAWLVSGDASDIPDNLRSIIADCREALAEGDVETVELLYVHNFPESVNVAKELQTAASHLRRALGDDRGITVLSRELGSAQIDHLFATQESHIEVRDEIDCPALAAFTEKGPHWEASVLSVPGVWLHELFSRYGESLFSANYRGFLGITRRRRINTGIRQSAETRPQDFWVFNNGITLLTLGLKEAKGGIKLTGVSVINGAQTTGSIGSVELTRTDLRDVQVLCRIIVCEDSETINEIIKYNNTQNEITTWDQYSNDPEQNRIEAEFIELGHAYSRKRGFKSKADRLGIEEVAQPLASFHGRWRDANRGKNEIFERRPLYNLAFENRKARQILLVHTLTRAIDERRLELKRKSSRGEMLTVEETQLSLMRNLRFKQFFVAVVGDVLEIVLGRKVDKDTIGFAPDPAHAKNNSIEALVAAWLPIVEAVVTYVATSVDIVKFGSQVSEDRFYEEVVKQVGALLYAGKASEHFSDFGSLVT